MKMRIVAACILLITLNACATTSRYEEILNSWANNDINRLIEAWGPPADTYTMPDGRVLYTWYYDGGAVAMPIANMAYAVRRVCKTTFTVGNDNRIQCWRYEGNACKAK